MSVARIVWLGVAAVLAGLPPAAEAQQPWSFSAQAYGYIVPDDRDFLVLTATADRRWLHLEGRYNYEDFETGSVFVGVTLAAGDDPWLELTPMLGGVFGNTTGIAPGYRLAAGYGIVDLYSEGEYLVAEDSTDNFFYSWSEVGITPLAWLRLGYSGQRTRLYQTELDIQRGPLVGLTYGPASLTTYVFNLGWESPTIVLAALIEF
jgi:hypothetical protein